MNKKEERWRIEGALYALRLAKEKGIDYLQEDIKRRGALGMSLLIPEKAAEEAYNLLAKKSHEYHEDSCHVDLISAEWLAERTLETL